MKKILFIAFVLLHYSSFAQTIADQIERIKTSDEVVEFARIHANLDITAFTVTAEDTTEINKELFRSGMGAIVSTDLYTYKILESSVRRSFRASYIFLDGSKLSKKSIDSLRTVIVKKHKAGASFASLVKEYNMDANSNNGDLGWFTEGMMTKEFEVAVRNHKKDDLFTVDIPASKWYYIALKTYDDREVKSVMVLRVGNMANE